MESIPKLQGEQQDLQTNDFKDKESVDTIIDKNNNGNEQHSSQESDDDNLDEILDKDREGEILSQLSRISLNITQKSSSQIQHSSSDNNNNNLQDDNLNSTQQQEKVVINSLDQFKNIVQNIQIISYSQKQSIYPVIENINIIIESVQVIIMKHSKDIELQTRFQGFLNTIVILLQQNYNLIRILYACNVDQGENILELEQQIDQKLQFIYEDYKLLEEFRIQTLKYQQINVCHLETIMKVKLKYVIQFKEICQKFEECKENKIKKESDLDSIWNDIKIIYSKFRTYMEIIPFVLNCDKNDLFSYEKDHEKWRNIQNNVEEIQVASPEKVQKSVKKVYKAMQLANAMVYKGSQQNSKFAQSLVKNLSAPYYFLSGKSSSRKAQIFLSEPNMRDAFKVWNLPEKGIAKFGLKLIYQSIEYMKKIYVQRLYKEINVENTLQEIQAGTINKIDNDNQKQDQDDCKKQVQDEENLYKKELFQKKIKEQKQQQQQEEEELQKEQKLLNNNRVTIRVLCHQNLVRLSQDEMENILNNKEQVQHEKMNFLKQLCTSSKNKQQHIFDKIIVHIHGGGFVSLSSRSFQTCTRKWANSCKVPIFSIDYGLAPQNPFPQGLNDCWQAYNWILDYVQKFFNVVPRKVILIGDSAGGNLVAALTARCIKHRVKVPDGLLMAYPVLNLSLKRYTPSHTIALDDPILTHTVLKLCQDAYLKQDGTSMQIDPEKDPFISPILLSDEILSKFPVTRIMVGTQDPLYDDSFRFLERQLKLNIDSKLIVYKGFPHGFLNFDFPNGLKYAAKTNQDIIEILNEMLEY